MMEGFAGITIILVLIAVVVGILWIILPFAIFGIKPKIDQGIRHLIALNDNLIILNNNIVKVGKQSGIELRPIIQSEDLDKLTFQGLTKKAQAMGIDTTDLNDVSKVKQAILGAQARL